MDKANLSTTQLLERCRNDDEVAREILFQRHLPWIRERVSRSMGSKLRMHHQSGDLVSDSCVAFLRYGPKLFVENETTFKRLMVRIILHTIRDKVRAANIRPTPGLLKYESQVHIDGYRKGSDTPSTQLNEKEQRAILHLGMWLLSPTERRVYLLRQRDGLKFAAVGEALGVSEHAAEARFRRAAIKLVQLTQDIESGKLPDVLAELDRLDLVADGWLGSDAGSNPVQRPSS